MRRQGTRAIFEVIHSCGNNNGKLTKLSFLFFLQQLLFNFRACERRLLLICPSLLGQSSAEFEREYLLHGQAIVLTPGTVCFVSLSFSGAKPQITRLYSVCTIRV
jgi:hypothetical protein